MRSKETGAITGRCQEQPPVPDVYEILALRLAEAQAAGAMWTYLQFAMPTEHTPEASAFSAEEGEATEVLRT